MPKPWLICFGYTVTRPVIKVFVVHDGKTYICPMNEAGEGQHYRDGFLAQVSEDSKRVLRQAASEAAKNAHSIQAGHNDLTESRVDSSQT